MHISPEERSKKQGLKLSFYISYILDTQRTDSISCIF